MAPQNANRCTPCNQALIVKSSNTTWRHQNSNRVVKVNFNRTTCRFDRTTHWLHRMKVNVGIITWRFSMTTVEKTWWNVFWYINTTLQEIKVSCRQEIMNLKYNNIANRQDYMHFGHVRMAHRQGMVQFQYDKMANEQNRMQFWELKITKRPDNISFTHNKTASWQDIWSFWNINTTCRQDSKVRKR